MSAGSLLTLNAGSSTVKLGLFAIAGPGPVRQLGGVVDFRRDPLVLRLAGSHCPEEESLHLPPHADMAEVMAATLANLSRHVDPADLRAVGHRVVHGGDAFAGPVRLDAGVVAELEALVPFAPLHQPRNLALIRAMGALRPDLAQTASFDTAFHRTNAPLVRRFALPRDLYDRGIRRYGFHGLSYRHIARVLASRGAGGRRGGGRAVVAHLGSGASLCAMEEGESRDTSMGFSTLDGIPMATRCGALDPGVLLHLLDQGGHTCASLREMLYHRSGLLGVSGISSDSRELLDSPDPAAREAIDLFVLRIAGEAARLAATLGGMDTLVFTAGIGENQPEVRRAVCARLAWLGVDLDPAANAAGSLLISTPRSRVSVMVVAADEEQIIAEEALQAIGG